MEIIAIGELSRRTRCNIETIRYYERIGLLPMPARRGRYRSFGLADVARVHFVRRARELGFTLDEIRALLGIATAEDMACGDAREIAASHLQQVRARITDLRRMERVLADTIRACDAGVDARGTLSGYINVVLLRDEKGRSLSPHAG